MPILNIRLTTTDENVSLSGNIISQDLTLQMASVQFTNTSSLPTAINIELPFINRFQVHNSQNGNSHLTIPVDVEKQSTITYPNLKFTTEHIASSFNAKIYAEDGKTTPTNIEEVQLWFYYIQPSLF